MLRKIFALAAFVLLSGIISIARADIMTLAPVNFKAGGASELVFSLDNQSTYYGFQADIKLPGGVTPSLNDSGTPDITLSDRFGTGYRAYANTLDDGTVRVGTFSLSHSPISGQSGVIFTLKVDVTSEFNGGAIRVTDIKFIDANDNDVNFPPITLSTTVDVPSTSDRLFIEAFEIMEGETKEVAVLLDNINPYTAFQTDIKLSPNLTIVPGSFTLTSRAGNHEIDSRTANGVTRVTCMSPDNNPFEGNEGALFTFSVTAAEQTGSASIWLNNNVFTSVSIQEYRLADSQATVTIVEPYVTSIILSADDATLLVGETMTLTAEVLPANAKDKNVTWSSGNNAVADVSADGTITALSVGTSTVTAKCGDVSATCEVTVKGSGDITVTPGAGGSGNDDDNGRIDGNDVTVKVNRSVSITISLPDDLSVQPKFDWSLAQGGEVFVTLTPSENTLTATFTGVSVGKTSYKLSLAGNELLSGKVTVIAEYPMSSLILEPTVLSLAQNALPYKLKTVYSPENASKPEFKWTSSDPAVAIVSDNGTVTPLKQGETTVTATAIDGSELTASCKVKVTAPIDGDFELTFDDEAMGGLEGATIYLGQTLTLTPTPKEGHELPDDIAWTTSDASIAIVTPEGLVSGVGLGTATITASATVNGETVSANCRITVIPVLAQSIRLSAEDLTLILGTSESLTATVEPANTTDKTVTWSTDNESVVTVSADGTVTALSLGSAIVTATCGDVSASCMVTVEVEYPMSSLVLEPSELSLAQNALPYKLKTVYSPENASMPEFKWTSSDPAVAVVSYNGTVTPLTQGETTVTATATDGSGLTASCKVKVTAPIDGDFDLTFDDESMGGVEGATIYLGQTLTLTPTPKEGHELPDDIAWTTSDASIATVTPQGVVSGVGLGTATITASATVNGEPVSANCKINVIPVPAQKITLSTEDMTLLVGQTDNLTATIEPENTTDKTITWKSDNASVASINTDGTVTALSTGTATITATCGDVTATCEVTVKGSDDINVTPGSGSDGGSSDDNDNGWLDGNDVTVKVNRSVSISISLPDNLSVQPRFDWSLAEGGQVFVTLTPSENTLTATFTGVSVGKTSYKISLAGNELLTGNVTVIAEYPMNTLVLEPSELSLAQNALPVKLKTVYSPENASMPEFNWTSSDPAVATVSDDGTVTPDAQGQTLITATAIDGSGLTATCEVKVTAPIDDDFGFDESVMGGVEGVNIYLGESYTLAPKAHDGYELPANITWSSSNPEIVSVDQNGKVTGLALGSATITALAILNNQEVYATCAVNVLPILISGITLNQSSAEMRVTESLTLIPTIEPDNATIRNLQWTTNAPSIASVNQEGVVTAHMLGEANITARATDGSNITASCKVKVVPTIATGITVSANGSTTLKAAQTLQLTATVTPETTTDKTVTWESNKTEIATVSESGVVKAIAVGVAKITATNSAGQTASIEITVEKTPVASIELNRNSTQIKVQEGFRLRATILPETATDKTVKWSSSAPGIVSVDGEGNVLALELGEATISCTAQDGSGVTAQCKVTVTTTAADGVIITAQGSTTLKATETVQLTATVLPETTTDKTVTWSSSNPNVAEVNFSGLVTAISVGEATVTVTNSAGQTAEMVIKVVPTPVESIVLNRTSASLKVRETLNLTATVLPETATDKTVVWTSADERIATVTQTGLVTAMSEGNTVIKATAQDGSEVSAQCALSVTTTSVSNITLTANGPTTLKASETVQLIARVYPETATDKTIIWTSDKPEIADVNENGLVTAFSVGEAVITAASSNGLTAQLAVTVEPTPVSSISLNRTSVTMRVTNELQLAATVMPSTATDKRLTWTSSRPSVVSVDENGKVTALLEGQAAITCHAEDGSGVAATCIVNVVDTDVEIITISADGPTTLKVSETVQLNASVLPDTSTDKSITWTSANARIAEVDDNGLVTAKSEGVTEITATTSNGLSDKITITVIETQISSITLNETTITLLAEETFSLIPNIHPNTATNKTLNWSSADTNVASVSQDGIVTGVAVGETTVTVSATDGSGVYAVCRVIVIPTPATGISISAMGETTLNVNKEVQLSAEVLPANTTDKSVTWDSSNPEVASVNVNGLVTGITPGETVITATNSAGQYDRITITVIPREREPISVTVSQQYMIVKDGDPVSLWVRTSGGNPDGWSYAWVLDGSDTPLSNTDTLELVAENKNATEPLTQVYVATVGNVNDGVLVFDEQYRFTLEIWSRPEFGDGDGEMGDDASGNGTHVSATKIREGNELTVSVDAPRGGYMNKWDYFWTYDDEEIGTEQQVTVTAQLPASVAQGFEKAACEAVFTVRLSNYGPDNTLWTQAQFDTEGVTVYKRPEMPLQLLRKGDGKSCTFIAMSALTNEQLASLGYQFVYGYADKDGGMHVLESTPNRYCHTTAEIYNDNSLRFWVYTLWTYADGSIISSGLRYLDGSADDGFDASVFDSATRAEEIETGEIMGIYTVEGRYLGKDLNRIESGIYVVRTAGKAIKIIK